MIRAILCTLLLALGGCSTPEADEEGPVVSEIGGIAVEPDWDTLPTGDAVALYVLENENGTKASLIDYGATLIALETQDRDGNLDDIVLGFDRVQPYTGSARYMGATVGRYANRIALGTFALDGEEYTLATNNDPNHLHGGDVGFDTVMWNAKAFEDSAGGIGVRFTYLSRDGEEGYPGNLTCTVTYTLTQADELRIDYEATTDKTTHVNLTHHSFFNLAGASSDKTIRGHELMISAAHYTPVDETLIPTGEIAPVAGTPLDFTTSHVIGERIAQVEGGYDHNFVLDGPSGSVVLAARVFDSSSGRVMEILTTEPGLHFYTGNFLDGTLTGKRRSDL